MVTRPAFGRSQSQVLASEQPVLHSHRPTHRVLRGIGEMTIHRGDLWSADTDVLSFYVTCQEGTVWITQEGNIQDFFLEPGARFFISKPGQVIAQALTDARIVVTRDPTR